MKRRIVFHFYYNKSMINNIMYRVHKICLSKYSNLFDDAIFNIVLDDVEDQESIDKAKKFILGCGFSEDKTVFHVNNNDDLRDTKTFYEYVVKDLGVYDGITFFGHSKGLTNIGTCDAENIIYWTTAMYYFNLENIDVFENSSSIAYGNPLVNNSGFLKINNLMSSPLTPKYYYYPVGTFMLIKDKELINYINENNIQIPEVYDRFYAENFVGNILPFETLVSSYNDIRGFDLVNFYRDGKKNIIDLYGNTDKWPDFEKLCNKFMLNSKIVCCIFNYKDDEKAKRWYLGLKDSFDTYLFDTFHKDNGDSDQAFLDLQPSDHIKFFNNIYFGGQYFEAYKLCIEKHARWMVTITSDLEIDEENLEKLKSIMSDEIYDSLDIGIYQPSAKEGSSCFGTCVVSEHNRFLFNNNTGGLRDIEGGEDWFFMTRMSETHNAFSLYQTGNYQLGWGIGYCFSVESTFDGFRNVIDDRVEVLHPFGTKYDAKEADRQYEELKNRFYDSLYHFTTTGIDKYFFKNPLDKDKYLVLTCAKNEDKYLVEFVEHYLNLGFDKVIIADNNDEPTILPILEKYLIQGTVEVWNCRKFSSFQVQLYAMFANEGNYKWCGYFDADEFLEIGCYSNIKDYLKTIKENCVSFNWINFGSNGQKHYKEGNLSERFKLPVAPIIYFKENTFIKSIVRGGDCWKGCWFNGSHIPYIQREGYPDRTGEELHNIGGYYVTKSYDHFYTPFRYKQGYIKHYYTKSFDEWMVKANRGWPDGTDNLKSSVFFEYETNPTFNFDKFIYSAFGEESDYYDDIYNKSDFFKDVLDNYSVIKLNISFLYSIYTTGIALMKATTNHTFVLSDEQVDDSLFTLLMECGFYTGNRVVCARNDAEVWNAFLKYHNKNEETYYIIYL